jgi:hypothetical protein
MHFGCADCDRQLIYACQDFTMVRKIADGSGTPDTTASASEADSLDGAAALRSRKEMRMLSRASFLSFVFLICALACQQGPGGVSDPETAVFPNEARLGGTIAIAIDSNYIPAYDVAERYDISPDGVEAWVRDDLGTEIAATVRAVFPLAPARSSLAAPTTPGRWVTIALVDLPSSGLSVPSDEARVRVTVDVSGAPVDVSKGTIRLVGAGGTPWLPPTPGYPALEEEFETRSLLRLRAVRRNPQSGSTTGPADAFIDSWEIGGLELEVQYPDCLEAPDAYPNSEADHATTLVGPGGTPESGTQTRRIVLLAPGGFRVQRPIDPFGVSSPASAGEGPILDLAFDRVTGGSTCAEIGPADFEIRSLFVSGKNGETLIDRRSGDTDSSALFTTFVIDAEPS